MDEMQIITNGEFNYRIEKARLEGVTPSFSGCEIKGVWAKYKDMERFDFSNSRLEDCDYRGQLALLELQRHQTSRRNI